MARQPTAIGPLSRFVLAPFVVIALVLGALVGLGELAVLPAVLAFIALAAALAVIMRPYVAGLGALTAYLDALAREGEPAAPSVARPLPIAGLASALARVLRLGRQQRQAAAARVASLDAVLDSLPDPLVMLDGRLRVVRANAAARALLGDAPIGGRDLATTIRVPALLEAAETAISRAVGARVEFDLSTPVKRSFAAQLEPLAARGGDEVALILVLHDLTATKRMDQMRADFVANASHELRTPLATLIGFIETLLGPASQDARARERFLGIMQQQAGRMQRLVDNLLSLSRVELHEHSPPTDPVDVYRLLRGVADALQPQCRAREMTIKIAAAAEALPPVVGDADELAQVFQNLVDNAIKYGESGSIVQIAAQRVEHPPLTMGGRLPAAGLIAITVADEGEGIAPGQIPRLTERFYRVDAARSRALGGTGLGLAIVKHIVNRHRGALQIESEVGRGSSFTVYLPAAAPPTDEAGQNAAASRPSHGTVTQTS